MKSRKSDARSRFRRRVFYDIVASTAITCIAEGFLVLNVNMMTGFLRQSSFPFGFQDREMLTYLFI